MDCSWCGKPEHKHEPHYDRRTRLYLEMDEEKTRLVVDNCIVELAGYDWSEWMSRLKAREASGYTSAEIDDDGRDWLE